MTDDRKLALTKAIMDLLPDHVGYVLVVVPYGPPGMRVDTEIMTNCRIEQMPRTLRSAAESLEKNAVQSRELREKTW